MNKVTSSLQWLLLVLAMLCTSSGLHAQGVFSFRAAHMVSGGPNIDIHFNNTAQATITNLGFEYVSSLAPTLPVGSGTVNVKIAPTGTGLAGALINRDMPVQANYEYIAVAYAAGPIPNVMVLERMKTQLPSGNNALLRVVNLTSITNPANFDFFIDSTKGEPRFTDIGREVVSPFISLKGDTKRLYIAPKGSTTAFAQVAVPLAPLAHVTLIITGTSTTDLKVYALNGENVEAYKLPVLPIEGVESGVLPSVRVMHAWREKTIQGNGVQALDLFLDSDVQPRGVDLKYRTATTKYGPLTGDSVALRFTPHDEALSTIYSQKIEVKRDTDYIAILTKTREGTAVMLSLKTPNTFPSEGPDRYIIRVAHVNDFYRNMTVKITPQGGGTPVTIPDMAFLTASDWYTIPKGPFTVEAYRQGENAPFYTLNDPGTTPPAYLTLVALGDAESFLVDVLNDLAPGQQVFDPAASVPTTPVTGPEVLALHNFPNPFTGSTTIGFSMPRTGRATIALFDVMGHQVAPILDKNLGAGEQTVNFDASGLPAGVYLYHVDAAGTQAAGRMVVKGR